MRLPTRYFRFQHSLLTKALTALALLVPHAATATIYGTDDLVEVDLAQAPGVSELARSVAVQMRNGSLVFNGPLPSRSLINSMVCSDERFVAQPVIATCSGFLISPHHLLTAGHCYLGGINPCKEMSWVFDYKIKSESETQFFGSVENVYACKRIVDLKYNGSFLDYAVVELDRPVTDRTPLKISQATNLPVGHPVFSIHSPRGLPMKYAPGFVRENSDRDSLVMAIDVMRGSSGAPIFDAKTNEVVALVAQGDVDYETQDEPFCQRFKKCPENECRGERGTRVLQVLSHAKSALNAPQATAPESSK